MNQKIMQELVDGILTALSGQVAKIILYGSVARGTDEKDSDVDVAVLVYGALDPEREERLSDFIVEMNLEYDRVFSVIDIEYEKFRKWESVMPFYENVNKEGIVLWKAA